MSAPAARAERIRQALAQCPLYFILDDSLYRERMPVALVQDVISAGVRMIQLRLKDRPAREILAAARRIGLVCAEADCLLIINDRVDIALLGGADGVHLGATDPRVADVRRIAPDLIIGGTARKPQTAETYADEGADYLGCGSVYSSQTKPGLPLIGVAGIGAICEAVTIPVVGIGGVTPWNTAAVLGAGAAGVAAVGAFKSDLHPTEVVQRFKDSRKHAGPLDEM